MKTNSTLETIQSSEVCIETVMAPMDSKVTQALDEIPIRSAIIDYVTDPNQLATSGITPTYESEKGDPIDREWEILTTVVQQALLQNAEVRQVLTKFAPMPLSENMPYAAVTEVAKLDSKTDRLVKVMGKTLWPVLALPVVPKELLAPDIVNAPKLVRREAEREKLQDILQATPSLFEDIVEAEVENITDEPGISEAERLLVMRRIRNARDIKILSLMAELYDQPIAEALQSQNGLVAHELSSGTIITVDATTLEQSPELLDAKQWLKRTQIKDRVYSVDIGGDSFILKERKTDLHTHIKGKAHSDGLTSEEEFTVGTQFANLGTIKESDLALNFERPIGYVTFTDGYQFCLFKKESILTKHPLSELSLHIISSPYWKFKHEERSTGDAHEFYATIIAAKMIAAAHRLVRKTIAANGYINGDSKSVSNTNQDIGYILPTDESRVLGIVAMDYEYYQTRSDWLKNHANNEVSEVFDPAA